MPAPTFKKVSLEQFADILDRFLFTRHIDAVHMHHTWRPSHKQFKGHDTIVGMWTYHTRNNGWSDIAQHITIDPQGAIWLGRNWNVPPASAAGHNGTSRAGPFMVEIVGDFDIGADPFGGAQRDTVLGVIAKVQQRFGLAPDSLKFHNMMSGQTCPGSGIDYAATVAAVRRLQAEAPVPRDISHGMTPPFPADSYEARQIVEDALEALARAPLDTSDPPDAQACDHDHGLPMQERTAASLPRGTPLSAAQEDSLRPHLLNLSMGEFSSEGAWTSGRASVDAIFDEHLPAALQRATARGEPLRIVFQAHGGLVDEAAGLAVALKSVAWWKANGIYPIYFVWETGAFETIGQLLRRVREGTSRDLFDYTSDPLVQEAARRLHGPQIWGGMKLSAQLASAADTVANSAGGTVGSEGGAHYLAQQLAAFCAVHGQDVELHAVGHSAGSIFHAWFIPCALALGVPPFRSLHLMAPAVRTDLFKDKLARLVGPGQGIDTLTLYTMTEELEQDDQCARVYRKSLLYLVFHALEAQRRTPILGLEECLRADATLNRLFGLDGRAADAQVVWSKTAATHGRNACTATTHGGFDDDSPTMNSIARRILGCSDAQAIVDYTSATDGARGGGWGLADGPDATLPPPPVPEADQPIGAIAASGPLPPRHRALCVGINDYPAAPLGGCLADVASWTRSLKRAGFEVAALQDGAASRAGILQALERLVQTSRAGDVIVFQFSGHGTQVPDLDGDEYQGDSPGLDEALCPHDYSAGRLLIDDDLGRIFDQLPDEVNLTCFIDCCHSGSVTRLAMGPATSAIAHGKSERRRYLRATPALVDAHRQFRQAGGAPVRPPRAQRPMREVVFSACLSTEVAWESDDQGEFTVRATRVLDSLAGPLSNAEFAERVSAAFGASPRQHARLYCHADSQTLPILQAQQGAVPAPQAQAAIDVVEFGKLLQGLREVQELQLQLLRQQHGNAAMPAPPPAGHGALMHSEPMTMQQDSSAGMQQSPSPNR